METTDTALYGGRNLTGYRADNGDEHCGWPEVAAEATRAMAHLTREPTSVKVAYETVGHMSHIPQTMAQTLTQIADGLRAPDRDTHTASFLVEAREALVEAAQRCRDAGLTLEDAHNALAHVGTNTQTSSSSR